jgi:transcriptional regulator with XRE-family HTH domain
MRTTLLDQIIKRREKLRIRSSEMTIRAGINRQQYEKIEKGGNPSLVTLDKIAEGLDAELMLIPKEKLKEVRRILATPFLHSTKVSVDGETISQSVVSPEENEFGIRGEGAVTDPWALIEREGKK